MLFVSDTVEILLKLAFNTNQSNNPLVCEPVLSKLNIGNFCKMSFHLHLQTQMLNKGRPLEIFRRIMEGSMVRNIVSANVQQFCEISIVRKSTLSMEMSTKLVNTIPLYSKYWQIRIPIIFLYYLLSTMTTTGNMSFDGLFISIIKTISTICLTSHFQRRQDIFIKCYKRMFNLFLHYQHH